MFFCRDLVQNEILGGTQTALLRAEPPGDNKRHRTSDNENCLNLNPICLGLDVKLYNPEAKDAAAPDNVLYSNNTLHYLFPFVELFLNGKLISSSNNNYHHAGVVETELATGTVSKGKWTVCQDYFYRPNKDKNLEGKNKVKRTLLIMVPPSFTSLELHMLTFYIASGYYCQVWHFTCAFIDRPTFPLWKPWPIWMQMQLKFSIKIRLLF